MKDSITKLEIYNYETEDDKEFINEMLDIWKGDIINMIELNTSIGNKIIICRNSMADINYDEELDIYHGSEINVSIASAITSYARIHMSQFKNNPLFKLYYSDTDSGVFNKPLPDHLIGSALGQVKLEHVIKKAVFLAPKVYGLITDDDKEIIKVKGLKSDQVKTINFSDLEDLLIQDSSKEFIQEKWNKSILDGNITIKDIVYNLKVTSNKREAIYENGIFTNTKPYVYKSQN